MTQDLEQPSRTLKLVIAYDGTDFCGWQRQPDQRTVQDEVEQVLRRVVRHPLTIHGAGRTDSGVHAAGQVAHLVTTSPIPTQNLLRAVRSRLPDDVTVVRVTEVPPRFHATLSAVSKLYRYRLWNDRTRPVEHLLHRYTYHFWRELDVARMQEAARYFVGHKDFAAMASTSSQPRRTTWRTVFRCDVYRHYREVRVDVEGSGFLYNMVRNMVGTLIEVGKGRWEPGRILEILESKDRSNAGQTAPANGLCMQWVKYVPGLWRPHPKERGDEFVDEPEGNGREQVTGDRLQVNSENDDAGERRQG
jgi:tRNA pseudouridine38-40 synthase